VSKPRRADHFSRAVYAAACQTLVGTTNNAAARSHAAMAITDVLVVYRDRGYPLSAVILGAPLRTRMVDALIAALPGLTVGTLTAAELDRAALAAAQAGATAIGSFR
jgi:hypothetical protein